MSNEAVPQPVVKAKKSLFKRWWFWLIAVVAVIVLVSAINGAGKKGNDPLPPASGDAEVSEPVETEPIDTEPEPEPEPEEFFEGQTFTGKGDDVVSFEVDELALVEFTCSKCEGHTSLKTDGRESLLANAIGSYSGSHWVNVREGSMVTKFTVSAKGSWELKVIPPSEAEQYHESVIEGSGDKAFLVYTESDVAEVKNVGEGHFSVNVYLNDEYVGLVVNEIGSYKGTVEFVTPGAVQVTSSGDWSITIKD